MEIRLRAVEPDDAHAMWEIESDKDSWRSNGMMAPFSMFNLREYAVNYDADPFTAGQIRMMAELVDEDGKSDTPSEDNHERLVGIVDLFQISSRNRTAFVGIYVRPQFREKGYASDMLKKLEEYAKIYLNLRILAAKVAVGNAASIRLFESTGYGLCGCLRSWMVSGDKVFDVNLYQKLLN